MIHPAFRAGSTILALLVSALVTASPALARQQPGLAPPSQLPEVLRGTVLNEGEPVPGVAVTLHRVRAEESGPVGTATSDASGGFTFRLPPPDSAAFAVFFATAEYAGVRYFGRAVHPDDSAGDYAIEVFDTASAAPLPVRLSRRDLMLSPQPDGGWEVDEVVRIANPNALTLVGAGGLPTWEFRIPEGVEAFEVGEGEVPAAQVQRMESRVLLSLPLLPGTRELYFRYRLPGSVDDAVLPLDSPADTFNLFVRQPSPTVSVTGLTSTRLVEVENTEFLQYSGLDLPVDSQVEIEWESAAPPLDPVVAAVGVTILLLAGAVFAALRSARRPSGPTPAAQRSAARDLAVGGAE